MLAALLLAAAAALPSPAPSCASAADFVGTICTPADPGKHPAIVVLGGSEGGNSMAAAAAQFARRGYVAASVAYFGAPGLPQTLQNVPVEPVGRALADLAARADVNGSEIAVFGGSKGGELALLAASIYPQIHAVVADVPSPFAWEGIPTGPSAPESSWTVGGKPLAYVAYSAAMGQAFADAYMNRTPLNLRKAYDASMRENAAQIPAAMFHLEKIRGPVLLLGADDDRLWDSDAQAELGIRYLREHHHPYADEYVHYPGAGHLFLFATPGHALTQVPMGPLQMLLGGTPQANLQAQAQAWPKIYAFLQSALQAAGSEPGK